jgi:hypothetical protein
MPAQIFGLGRCTTFMCPTCAFNCNVCGEPAIFVGPFYDRCQPCADARMKTQEHRSQQYPQAPDAWPRCLPPLEGYVEPPPPPEERTKHDRKTYKRDSKGRVIGLLFGKLVTRK